MMNTQLLTKDQINSIVSIIKEQCEKYSNLHYMAQELYYAPYSKMRRQHDITGAVLSAFKPNGYKIPGLSIEKVEYGRKNTFAQPEFKNENVVFHIVSHHNSLNSNFYLEKCKEYNSLPETKPTYALIIFLTTREGHLKKIDFAIPNDQGKIIASTTLYEDKTPIIKIA